MMAYTSFNFGIHEIFKSGDVLYHPNPNEIIIIKEVTPFRGLGNSDSDVVYIVEFEDRLDFISHSSFGPSTIVLGEL